MPARVPHSTYIHTQAFRWGDKSKIFCLFRVHSLKSRGGRGGLGVEKERRGAETQTQEEVSVAAPCPVLGLASSPGHL